jgi:peptidoglycan/xylan/chitin deacetylase (PgdA/CDA1 family)
MRLDSGSLIISIDVDVGSSKLGELNKGGNDRNVNKLFTEREIGAVEEHALPLFIRTFEEFEVPATFALRGELLDIDSSFLNLLLASSVKHDIGVHGYSHKAFTHLSWDEADDELKMASYAMRKFGIVPRSFIFPKNMVNHLDLLVKHGYKCFRSIGGIMHDCMYIEKKGDLYDIHPSLYLDQGVRPTLLKKILDIAVKKKTPLHIWFHMWNFGNETDMIQAAIDTAIRPLLKHAWKRKQQGLLRFETMISATEEVERAVRQFPMGHPELR